MLFTGLYALEHTTAFPDSLTWHRPLRLHQPRKKREDMPIESRLVYRYR
jgi:hypothetical protein